MSWTAKIGHYLDKNIVHGDISSSMESLRILFFLLKIIVPSTFSLLTNRITLIAAMLSATITRSGLASVIYPEMDKFSINLTPIQY